MKKESKQPQQPAKDDKEKEPVERQQQYESGKERPEQAPDVPPQERTVGIP